MKAVILLADGFEEIEALAPADIWRRLGAEVTLAGLKNRQVTGSHGIAVTADTVFLGPESAAGADVLFLPGGLPGATNLRDDVSVLETVKAMVNSGRIIAAICAAPSVLGEAGVVAGRRITGYPGTERLTDTSIRYTGQRTEADGPFVTGIGPGASEELAFLVAEKAGIPQEKVNAIRQGMFWK